ncbi:MAG: hypothetical protein K0Q76_2083 [Panacagrimonas sp.]|jgi:hypothetical protein|nr:hypothetical protein [Panacagrimonas sp.]MCC2656975.1 hypothetical protein [Panacagrimonas sp.]
MLATRRLLHPFVLLICSVLTTACGGGGGSTGGSSGGGDDTSVAVAERAFTVTTHHDSMLAPAGIPVDFTLSRIPRAGINIEIGSPSEALLDAQYEDTGPTTGRFTLMLASGQTLGAGRRAVSVQLNFCYDEACNEHVAGSPVTVAVDYDVRPEERKVRVEVVDPSPVYGVTTDPAGPIAHGTVRVYNPPAEGVNFDYSGGKVVAVSTAPFPGGYQVDLQMRAPASAGLGRHTSNSFLTVCFADDCGRGRDVGYPRMNVDYTVTAVPVQQVRSFDLPISDLAWDPVHRWLILLPTVGSFSMNSNRGVMEPNTGTLYFDPTGGPTLHNLSLSPDGQWFVADDGRGRTLYRFARQDLTQSDRLQVQADPADPSPWAQSVQVLDLEYGPDGTLALLTADDLLSASPAGVDLRLMDGMSTRADRYIPAGTLSSGRICSFTWRADDANSMLASTFDPGYVPLAVSASGLAPAAAGGNGFNCSRGMRESTGRIFHRDGTVRSAGNGALVKRLGVETGASGEVQDLAVDETLRRVYVLHTLSTDEAGDARVTAYDLDSLARIGSTVLRQSGQPHRLVRWGERGLALPTRYGKLLLIEGGIVDGSAAS